MSGRLGLAVIDGLLLALLVLRMLWLKRALDRYRPPSPLPPARAAISWEGLTVRRVS